MSNLEIVKLVIETAVRRIGPLLDELPPEQKQKWISELEELSKELGAISVMEKSRFKTNTSLIVSNKPKKTLWNRIETALSLQWLF